MDKNRVCCLYRVSTNKQVDYNANHEADIPMQRKACHDFAERMGWKIIEEEQEEGVSGHKVRAADRDKLQIIKKHAEQKQFDILLVFMFDRLGRLEDETPFVAKWFVSQGIQVWSTQEGEMRFDNHIDKLMNYIRFWQADGESVKTSIRTKTSMRQMVEEGRFKGGPAPYGYQLVKNGRTNKRNREVFDLVVNEKEAPVVRIIFDKYVHEGYGAQRIATYLNNQGYRARTGKMWHHASIRGIICNLTYTGVLRCGESHSPVIPELQIISPELFDAAQQIRTQRANAAEAQRTVPLNTRGKSLLAGNVFCGHCGSRLSLTTVGRNRMRADGSFDKSKRIRYICYGKTRKQTECDGQTGYTMHILDGIVDKLIRQVFSRMTGIPKQELISSRFEKETSEQKMHLASLKSAYTEASADLTALKSEIVKCIQGKSSFSEATLSNLIAENETKCEELRQAYKNAREKIQHSQEQLAALNKQYDDIVSLAELYDSANIEARKMVVNSMIKRVRVFRGYHLEVEFNFNLDQFIHGLNFEMDN
ncbi:MAG: recombinase family protein [Eubacteriales bacterium]|nr:recombinase family protein [Eubacteriales bacterium]